MGTFKMRSWGKSRGYKKGVAKRGGGKKEVAVTFEKSYRLAKQRLAQVFEILGVTKKKL